MKIRILMLSLIGLIFFNSCSNDSNSTNSSNSPSQNLDPNTLLPKKVIINGRDNPQEEIYEFFYNQNKINYIKVKSYDGGTYVYNIYFTYNGDLITQISFDDPNTTDDFNISYKYQNNQLIQIDDSRIGSKIVYTYNSNGTITSTDTFFDKITNYTLNNGLISSNLTNGDRNFTYFINSYSPYKNITGIDKISLFPDFILFDVFLFPKNISQSYSYEYFYTYNDILFPTSFFIQQFSPIYPTINIIKIIKNYTIIYN